MKRYEYKFVDYPHGAEAKANIERLAAEGWRIAFCEHLNEVWVQLIMEREVIRPDPDAPCRFCGQASSLAPHGLGVCTSQQDYARREVTA